MNIVKTFEQFTDNQNNIKFKIPSEIEQLYDISGDLSNAKNWKAKIITANSGGDKKKGAWDSVGYVMISLTTNYIIPIARADEHRLGYETLEYLIKKYKIKNLNYQHIYVSDDSIVYGGEYHDDEYNALKKAYEYGLKDILIKQYGGDRYDMSIEEYLKYNGDFNKAIATSKEKKIVSNDGQKFINKLSKIVDLFERYDISMLHQNHKFEETIVDECKDLKKMIILNSKLWDIFRSGSNKNQKLFRDFCDSVEVGNISKIKHTLLYTDGIKNTIHNLLRKDDKNIEKFFWSNEGALEQFNAMYNKK